MSRNYLLDNAKILMMMLVVFGHFIEPLINYNAIIKSLYLVIYTFHMPVFILIAGMLSKAELNKGRVRHILKSLLIPLLIFTLLYEGNHYLINGSWSGYGQNYQPYWILWFLVSLVVWRLLLPLFIKLKYPILISMLLAVGAGYIESIGYFLGISRTLYFLPFFLIGYQLAPIINKDSWLMRTPKFVWWVLIAGNIALAFYYVGFPQQWLYGSLSYAKLGVQDWSGGIVRAILLALSSVSAIAVLLVLPRRRYWFTSLGQNSLYIYLWHGLIVKWVIALGMVKILLSMTLTPALITLITLSLVLTLLLSVSVVATATERLLFDPLRRLLPASR